MASLFDPKLERGRPGQGSQTPGITQVKTPGKMPKQILALLRARQDWSMPDLAVCLGKSVSAVARAIYKLSLGARLERIGPAKGRHWKVLDGAGSRKPP